MAHSYEQNRKREYAKGGVSFPLLLITITLILIGVVMVFSSTYVSTVLSGHEGYRNAVQHTIVAVLCILIICIGNKLFNYRWLNQKKFVWLAVIGTIGLLGLVFLFPARNDAHRWIEIGPLTIQPSEIAKFVAVIYMAYFASHNRYWYSKISTVAMFFAVSIAFAGLIFLEPNLSTTVICIVGPALIMALVSGLNLTWAVIGGILAVAFGVYVMFNTDWRAGRMLAWLDPWYDPKDVSFQVVQSLYALGNGGLFGVGLGNSKQKISYLPMKDTDYIFAIIAEEFGFIGAALVIALYAAFVFFAIKVALKAPDAFGCFLAVGITVIVAMQAIVNIAVVTNTIPSTGVTLPFISRGTSSLLCFSVGAMLLLNISRYSKQKKDDGAEGRRVRGLTEDASRAYGANDPTPIDTPTRKERHSTQRTRNNQRRPRHQR